MRAVSRSRVLGWTSGIATPTAPTRGSASRGTTPRGRRSVRGIQLTDDNGQVTFQTVYPGWYQGRITHVHFQVFLDSGLAATSQIAFPEEATAAVYAVDPYAAKGPNTSVSSFSQDMVFADGTQYQMASTHRRPQLRLQRHAVGGGGCLSYCSRSPGGRSSRRRSASGEGGNGVTPKSATDSPSAVRRPPSPVASVPSDRSLRGRDEGAARGAR